VGVDDKVPESDLVSCREAAKLADVSRQAVIQAAKDGRLEVVGWGPRGRQLLRRHQVDEWKKTVRRVNRRLPDGEMRGAPGEKPERRAGSDPSAPPPTRPGSPAAGIRDRSSRVLSKVVAAELVAQILTPAVAEQHRAALLAEAANRLAAAEIEKERLDMERREVELRQQKVELELRKVEIERRRVERDNNVRQLRERVAAWLSMPPAFPKAAAVIMLPLSDRVFAALGDDAVANAAAAGSVIEHALGAGCSEWNVWSEETDVLLSDPRGQDELVRLWILKTKAALETPPQATAASRK
jgi:hypothetical protein